MTKDHTCTVREIELGVELDVPGFVRVLDSYKAGESLRLLVLCDEDPIVWRLRFAFVAVGESWPCLTGLTYVARWAGHAIFHHPPTRAGDEPWEPGRADMTLVEPTERRHAAGVQAGTR